MTGTQGEAAKLIEDILSSKAVLFLDQYKDAYIAFNGDGSEIQKISSKTCKQWINLHSLKQFGKVPSTAITSQVQQILEAQASLDGKTYPLDVRCVKNDTGLWYDLGKQAIHIHDGEWIVTDSPDVVFRRLSHQKPQVTPKRGGSPQQLLKYINITNEHEQLLFLVFTIAAFIPGFPHPLLILHGTQGAGKSTPMQILKRLIDPSALESGLPLPDNLAAFAQTANHNYYLHYDNLSAVPDWFSDGLARASTGSAFSKRVLFSDDEDVIYSFQRTVALNGINQVVNKPDLLDRSILLRLERISPERRKESGIFWAEFEEERPNILGGIFDTLAKAMTIYPALKLSKLPRMADFARWGCAIAEAAGYSSRQFLEAYSENITSQHEQAIEANPLAQAIIEFMSDGTVWSGTPAELYGHLRMVALRLELEKSEGWPKDAARLSRALNILLPNLEAAGVLVERPTRGTKRIITLRKLRHGVA